MKRALTGADIFDGERLHRNQSLLLDGKIATGVVAAHEIPTDYTVTKLSGGTILPGFVDLQVNGGGGVMFNDMTSVAGLRIIAEAHAKTGTRTLLPTLITDTAERTRAAVDAVTLAVQQHVPGIVGLHLEGPHLSLARKGAHDPNLIRPMTDEDEAFLIQSAARLPNLMVTVAPENVTVSQISRLARAGVIVSLGHTDCSLNDANAAFEAGAHCVTHLFNAMSQMGSREPGLVGASLDAPEVYAGLISDGIHVHPSSVRAALNAKQEPGKIFLVTDAMSTVGSDITEFVLNGRRVIRKNGRLTLADGTLAGADLEMPQAVALMVNRMKIDKATAFAMATSFPGQLLRNVNSAGRIIVNEPARAIWLDESFSHRTI